ncbi:ATP-grasp domain-containing protein [Kocuria marina]|uniref:ATP-grasp domain-containing protein n=1 Tax=Kocuria marina TaxID=223184 RepID=UPI003460ACD4
MQDTTASHGKPVLLTIGLCSQTARSSQPYRGYMLDIARELAAIWLFDIPGQNWQDNLVLGKTEFDVFDTRLAIENAKKLALEHPILGVWCPDEATARVAAAVAEELGLPGPGVEAILRGRDKSASRQCFAQQGLRQPVSRKVRNLDEARKEAANIGYPVIIKPRNLGASMGVVLVHSETDLASAYEGARDASYHGIEKIDEGVLVEEFLVGPEVAVDAYFDGSCLYALGVANKHLGFAPYFEEVGHDVLEVCPEHIEIVKELEAAHKALGLGSLVTHSEVRLTERGPVVIEINVRPGGDFIPILIEMATGVSSVRVSVEAALGLEPTLTPTKHRAAAIRFCYVPYDGTVVRVDGGDLNGVDFLDLTEGPTLLKLPPRGFVGRYAAVLSEADHVKTASALADQEASKVRVTME